MKHKNTVYLFYYMLFLIKNQYNYIKRNYNFFFKILLELLLEILSQIWYN